MNNIVQKALVMLEDAGFEAYIAGGAVRDLLLGTVPHDYDIATSALPQQTAQVFSQYKTIDTGLKHGTVTVIMCGMPLEITTFRRDGSYLDSRHPDSVTFVTSLKEDLSRRDFTVCAMAMDRSGRLFDFFGGQEDLKNRLIRCVGDPSRRFEEDALRLMRALRFASTLSFDIEEKTAAAIDAEAERIRNVSAERIASELFKTLQGDFADLFLRYTRLLSQIIPEIDVMRRCAQHNIHHIYDVWEHSVRAAAAAPPDPIIRFSLLLHDAGKPETKSTDEKGQDHFYGHADASYATAARICGDLRLSNANTRRILTLVKYHDYPLSADKKLLRRRLAKFGAETLFDLLAVKRADNAAQSPVFDRSSDYDETERSLRELLSETPCLDLRSLRVDGNDLLSLGCKGKQIGDILNKLLALVIDGALENRRDLLLEQAKKLLDKSR